MQSIGRLRQEDFIRKAKLFHLFRARPTCAESVWIGSILCGSTGPAATALVRRREAFDAAPVRDGTHRTVFSGD